MHYAIMLTSVGSGYETSPNSRPADILVPNWMIGKPAAFDLTVVSPLNSNTLNEAGATGGSAAWKADARKHNARLGLHHLGGRDLWVLG